MLVTWDTGVSVHTWIGQRCHGKHGEHRKKLYQWYGDRVERRESCKPRLNPRPEKWFFPDPRFTQKSPKMGEGQFFPPLPQKMPILFHSGNKRQFKLCPKSVSNYQNQLVEAEKLFKKSHIFAWFHCTRTYFRLNIKKKKKTATAFQILGKGTLTETLYIFEIKSYKRNQTQEREICRDLFLKLN